jgi:protein-tyrosine phosphatase
MAAGLFSLATSDFDEPISVCSAGLLEEGRPVPGDVVAVMKTFGVDLADHRSKHLTAGLVADADLILTMERRHAREVVLLEPSAWARTFTLKEMVNRAEKVGARAPDQSLGSWLAQLHEGRERAGLAGRSSDDDIADPLGRPTSALRSTARQLADLIHRLTTLVWPGGS